MASDSDTVFALVSIGTYPSTDSYIIKLSFSTSHLQGSSVPLLSSPAVMEITQGLFYQPSLNHKVIYMGYMDNF